MLVTLSLFYPSHWKTLKNFIMRKVTTTSFLLIAIMLFTAGQAYSQRNFRNNRGNGRIVKSTETVPPFDEIRAGAADNIIILTKGNTPYSVVIQSDENMQNAIHVSVKNKVLRFSYTGINPTKLRFYVTVPSLSLIHASGASVVKSADTLGGQMFKVIASGAANVNLMLNFQEIEAYASGAADLYLTGKTKKLTAVASGAADIKTGRLVADSVFAKASGASDIRVNAQKFLSKDVSTAASVKLVNGSQKTIQVPKPGEHTRVVVYGNPVSAANWNDTTRVNVGSIHVEVIDGDTTKVTLGGHTLIVDGNGDVKWKRTRPVRFNGHWAGVDIGINGYFTPSFNTDFGKSYSYLNQRYEKSINVNVNIFEQNIAFNKAKTIGLVTGIGLSFNDYRFTNPTYLSPDSNEMSGFYMRNVNVRKSKLSLFYLTVPVIFEFQTNNPRRSRRFFVGVGMLINARLRTHTKIYFNEPNKQYYLEDPANGTLLPGYYTTPNRANRNIVKSVNSFNLQPFRFDATLRIGYGIISLYTTYALNQMFLKGQGPALNQWSAGISISGW